jgi:arylsulfatase A-like enzyme
VLVSLDALSALHVGAYGYERDTTPALDAIAERGTLFERAWSQQLWTLTSHVTMMTGLYVATHGASRLAPMHERATTLAEILSAQGFATAAFTGAGGYMKPDFGLGRGFDVYAVNASIGSGAGSPAAWLRQQAVRRERDPAHRFFLFVHFYDIHSDEGTDVPYAAPERYRERFLPDGLAWRRRGDTRLLAALREADDVDASDRAALRDLYDAEVLHADQERLAPLASLLDALDLADDTLLIVTSDHGEELLEHGGTTHGQPYEEAARVPLVLRGPGIPAGARIAARAELVDLLPTVLDALELPVPPHVQGESLLPLIAGDAPRTPGAHVDGRWPAMLGSLPSAIARDEDGVPWTLVAKVGRRNPERVAPEAPGFFLAGPTELYRLDRDPGQQHDLAAEEPERAARLGAALVAWHERTHAAGRRLADEQTASPAEPILSDAERERLRAIGYAE